MGSDMKLEDALQQLKNVAKQISRSQLVKPESLKQLDDLYHAVKGEEFKTMLGDALAKYHVGVVFKKSMTTLDKASDDINLLLRVCWNYSHASRNIGEELGRVGMIAVLTSSLREDITSQELKSESIVSRLAILYNCATTGNKKLFRSSKSTETLLFYSKQESPMINMIAILTLSYIVDEENAALISADASIIDMITSQLEKAVASTNHKVDGWTAYELTVGLKNLANNADNTKIIMKKDLLPPLLQMFVKGNEDEQEIAGETIWMLSFQDEVKQKILKDESAMNFLKEVSKEEGSVAETALGILWVLGEKKLPVEKKREMKKHIMISYQWSSQTLMNQVYEELTKHGYNVWMDIHDLNGSILEAMAEAVENAAIVLVCMTQKYKDSPNCRTEAEYAFNLRKEIIPIKAEQDYKADGWLGALTGTKLYIDFSSLDSFEGETFDGKVDALVKEIEGTDIFSSKNENTTDNNTSNGTLSPDKNKNQNDKSTTEQDGDEAVTAWMNEYDIDSYCFDQLTAKEMRFLSDIKYQCPEIFYQFLAGDIGVRKLREIIKISSAVDHFEA
ncbi:uncharacterized protein LOC120328542 [Styela clava]|uniref:uncharacterized protein LOC120328542 n=1 Tax=Styela clava TaxID=7725 RepID=UPI00193ACB0C|nr:uncharacterized protein LOC120328542 [Styela clava]